MYVEIGVRGVSGLGVYLILIKMSNPLIDGLSMEEIEPHNDTALFSVMEVIASFLLLGLEIK